MKYSTSSWLDMINYGRITVFTDDETFDLGELNFLLGLALKDGKIDEEERNVLRLIFHKVESEGHHVPPRVMERINEVRERYQIPL
jgi:predicted AAA+ superfamily ATPase